MGGGGGSLTLPACTTGTFITKRKSNLMSKYHGLGTRRMNMHHGYVYSQTKKQPDEQIQWPRRTANEYRQSKNDFRMKSCGRGATF